jgi:hypothetical protein
MVERLYLYSFWLFAYTTPTAIARRMIATIIDQYTPSVAGRDRFDMKRALLLHDFSRLAFSSSAFLNRSSRVVVPLYGIGGILWVRMRDKI